MKNIIIFLLSITLIFSHALAEEEANKGSELAPQEARIIETLDGLMQQIEGVKSRLKQKTTEEEELQLTDTLASLRMEFDELLAGTESVAYFQTTPTSVGLQDELLDIFDPLIAELKDATSNSREKEQLRNKIEKLEAKSAAAQSAVERIEFHLGKGDALSSGLKSVLSSKLALWQTLSERSHLELESTRIKLNEKEKGSVNAVESASQVIGKFFKTRGFHLVLAFIIALLAYCFITFSYRLFTQYSPTHKKEKYLGTSKTIDGATHLISIIVAIFALLLTLFLYDDWVLLTAALLIIIGGLWALKDKLADLMEEIRLILNTGAVREGERIFYDGLAWRVDKIRVYSQLVNPQLDGGAIRIPINKMVGLHSHPDKGNLKFFPTSKGDWVILSDETFGKVLHQTPEYVELVQLGGAHKTYRTQAFLDLSPVNLSNSSYRIVSTFGVDYKHQADVTEEIANQMQKEVKDGIKAFLEEPTNLVRLKVEFASASTSSLDFKIIADFKSEVAPKYHELNRLIQRQAVEACNKYDWEIPFTQITLHQAKWS